MLPESITGLRQLLVTEVLAGALPDAPARVDRALLRILGKYGFRLRRLLPRQTAIFEDAAERSRRRSDHGLVLQGQHRNSSLVEFEVPIHSREPGHHHGLDRRER